MGYWDTNLRLTGAIAGLLAGALGATAYAFHCSDDSVPFIAFWYGVHGRFLLASRRAGRALTAEMVTILLVVILHVSDAPLLLQSTTPRD
jgi:Negative regulator of sigma F